MITVMILGMVMAGLWVIGRWDKPLALSGKGYGGILGGALTEGAVTLWIAAGEPIWSVLLLAAAGGCLLLACAADLTICQVYNFTWWPALAAAAVSLWPVLCGSERSEWYILRDLLLFVLLQYLVFCRVYGRADCHAFCVCAAVEAAMGLGMLQFLLHMLAAYVLLLLVQLFRGNMNRKGNLKQPVPFLPYITAAFWTVLVFEKYILPLHI